MIQYIYTYNHIYIYSVCAHTNLSLASLQLVLQSDTVTPRILATNGAQLGGSDFDEALMVGAPR